MMKPIKFIAWAEGDHTVGDGTFNAELTIDATELDVAYIKDRMKEMLSLVWDLRERSINVMTKEDYRKFSEND